MDLLVIVLSYGGVSWPEWVIPIVFAPLFPVFFVALMIGLIRISDGLKVTRRDRPRIRDVVRGAPAWVIVCCATGFYGGLLLALLNLSAAGQPEVVRGVHYFDDHGSLTQISAADYQTALAQGVRLFASGSLAFASASLLLAFPPTSVRPVKGD